MAYQIPSDKSLGMDIQFKFALEIQFALEI